MNQILYQAFLYLTYFIQGVLIGRIILSWFRVPALSRITDFLYHVTEPILAPLRVVVEHSIFGERRGGITVDISPLIAFMILDFLRNYVEMIFLYVS